jgi:hypothetical protein
MIRNIQNALWRLILVANVRLVLAMASRKPLVQVGGEIQQLQAGDTLTGPFADTEQVSLTNDDVGSHVLGDVVYIDAADGAKKAKADAAATSKAIAFATATVTAGSSGSYQTSGVLAGLDRADRRLDVLPERGDRRRDYCNRAKHGESVRRQSRRRNLGDRTDDRHRAAHPVVKNGEPKATGLSQWGASAASSWGYSR